MLKLFVVSRNLGAEFYRSLSYMIMSSANMDNLTTSLPICILFISSSFLFALARNYKTMLNRNAKNGHLCLVPGFRGNGFSFSPLSIMLAIGLQYIAFGTFLVILVSSQFLS
jgi:hypothetical protein